MILAIRAKGLDEFLGSLLPYHEALVSSNLNLFLNHMKVKLSTLLNGKDIQAEEFTKRTQKQLVSASITNLVSKMSASPKDDSYVDLAVKVFLLSLYKDEQSNPDPK